MNEEEAKEILIKFAEGNPAHFQAKSFLEGHAAGVEAERKRMQKIIENHKGCSPSYPCTMNSEILSPSIKDEKNNAI